MKIAITGGTGTLGYELTRQLLARKDTESIRIFSRSESRQAEMERKFGDKRLRFLIGDVRDYERVRRAMRGVDRVFHCAALKRVEKTHDVEEIIKTNISGTCNVCNAAESLGIEKVLFISSDKAVYPANVYGMSKAVGEQKVLQMNGHAKTKFSLTRYGNVLGSTGSVLQLWKEQASKGEIKITDPTMTRFWISVQDAARFVIEIMDSMKGGEIFIPKMKSFEVRRLAKLLYPMVKQITIPLRDRGEKLHETMITHGEMKEMEDMEDRYVIGAGKGLKVIYNSYFAERYTDKEMMNLCK